MLRDTKPDFSRFLGMDPQRMHFAAHSHHFWPDVTFEAQQKAWHDAALMADHKWDHVFGELMFAVQKGIAARLSLPDLQSIAFAPNTHEFVLRLLSCCPSGKAIRILTTDSEFHSFRRQAARLAEDGLAEVTVIASEPHESFTRRFSQAAEKGGHDIVFFSHVFFNSGYVVDDLAAIVASVADQNAMIIIDGYHGFMAVPTDLSPIADRAFYLAGGYKYAMAGEGACFMHCPPARNLRPRNTGWFAEMDSLADAKTGHVSYAEDGLRFAGATFDPTGLYRMRAVFAWLDDRGITVADIHQHVAQLQNEFLDKLKAPILKNAKVLVENGTRGHFLTFVTDAAAAICETLADRNIIVDHRGDRLRFGFGIYHDRNDIARLINALEAVL